MLEWHDARHDAIKPIFLSWNYGPGRPWRRTPMPGNWDPQVYRARAQQWRDEAEKMPPGALKMLTSRYPKAMPTWPTSLERDGQDRSIRGFMGTNAIVHRETAAD